MADRDTVERELRAVAMRLLALCDELGVGAANVYADPCGVRYVTGCAWPAEGGEATVASFSEFPGEEGGDE